MKSALKRKLGYIALCFFVTMGIFIAGIIVGRYFSPDIDQLTSISGKEKPVVIDADFEAFWKTWNTLNEKSIYKDDVTNQDRVWGAIKGLASSMNDPYTVFFSPEENKLFNDEIHGSFGGIGAEIGVKDKVLTIVAPLKDSPSYKAGLKSGDKILLIDNKETVDLTIDQAIGLIRGKEGTAVALTVLRPGEDKTRDFKIVRDVIMLPTIETKVIDDVFLITLYSFSDNSYELFKDAIQEFINSKKSKLIVDLRGNPGGYLDAAINISSLFIDQGKPIVIEDFGDTKKQKVYRSHGPRLFTENLKMAVLIDGGSASASEILAGALKEHKIATLVGSTTYGKGSVQELISITEDTSLKVTVAKWLTPNGVSISLKGLEPDVKVEYTVTKDGESDTQLEKAVELLQK